MISPGLSPPEPTSSRVGLGYGIAMAVSTLVLISAIMLASYACLRLRARPDTARPPSAASRHSPTSSSHAILPGPVMAKVCWPNTRAARYPKLVLGESRRLPRPNSSPCSICLADYEAKETIRCMPDCNHCFHVTCIDQWLRISPTCPICRSSPAPSAVGTPFCIHYLAFNLSSVYVEMAIALFLRPK
ncbi:hypothetical protein Cgig2_001690 [Carnegiea gigantea]|uniref:RING-type domain-containing protein n=1 Tax=Carnegiea gigantea TaxID=171969 RepID=A0A9Q1GS51_9CARY|nr:hypothetical protein Cgig2_001690 [Carnegiea gigantea]